MTAIVDLFPEMFRKKGRREMFILGIAVICYLLGLLLITEVSHRRRAEMFVKDSIILHALAQYSKDIRDTSPALRPTW